MSDCTLACWAMPDCTVCGKRKKPHGRDAPLAGCYCDHECLGYFQPPKAGHYWPEEEPELKALAKRREVTA